jgi:hypothetical protein
LFAASLDDCVHFIAFFIPRALWRRCKLIKQRALVPDVTGFFELPEAAHGRSLGVPPESDWRVLRKGAGNVKESAPT